MRAVIHPLQIRYPSPLRMFHRLEKLELLRQNVSCQHEVQRLRDREMQLQADLNTASREINRLRDGFVTSIMAAKSRDEPTRRIEAADKTDKVWLGKLVGGHFLCFAKIPTEMSCE